MPGGSLVCTCRVTFPSMSMPGPERKSAVIRQEEKEITAYHEGGHAIVALYTPGQCNVL